MDYRDRSELYTEVIRDVSTPMYAADPVYLGAMFDELDTRHGGIEAYARDRLELTDGDLAVIRANLLQKG